MAQILIIAGIVLALYLVWRARFGHVPGDTPQVLCFHKLSRRFLLEGTWSTPRHFAAVIDRLLARGYRFVSEEQYLSALDMPHPDHARTLFLTFDDAYECVFTEALPILRERGVPFHVFVVGDYVGRENAWELGLGRPREPHASWQQLAGMVAAGGTVGSHTASHRDLTRLGDRELAEELTRSRETIEAALGRRVRTVSYPFGRCNPRVTAAARAAGYSAGFSLYPRHHNSRVDRFALRRNGVYVIDAATWVERKLAPNAWFWFEEIKCRTINAVAVLTPILTRRRRQAPDRGSESRNGRGSSSATAPPESRPEQGTAAPVSPRER